MMKLWYWLQYSDNIFHFSATMQIFFIDDNESKAQKPLSLKTLSRIKIWKKLIQKLTEESQRYESTFKSEMNEKWR